MSLMMMVENELTTPFGMALKNFSRVRHWKFTTTYAANTATKTRTVLGS